MKDSVTYYTVYDSKTEEILASGDAAECAETLKMTLHTFYSTVSRVKSGKNKKYEIDYFRGSGPKEF